MKRIALILVTVPYLILTYVFLRVPFIDIREHQYLTAIAHAGIMLCLLYGSAWLLFLLKQKWLALSLVLLCAPAMWGATFTATISGDFQNGTTWGNSGTALTCPNVNIPCSTDTAVIPASKSVFCSSGETCVTQVLNLTGTGIMTAQTGSTFTWQTGSQAVANPGSTLECQTGATCNIGSNPAVSLQMDFVANSGSSFLMDAGSTLNMNASIQWSVANANPSTFHLDGHTVCTPNSNAYQQEIKLTVSSAGSNTAVFSMQGASHAAPAVFETVAGQSAGKTCLIVQSAAQAPKVAINHVIFNNLGDNSAAHQGFYVYGSGPGTQSDYTIQDVLMLHSGAIEAAAINNGVGTPTTTQFLINGVDCRLVNQLNANCLILSSANATALTANTRKVLNITCDNESWATNQWCVQINGAWFQLGQSNRAGQGADTPGLYSYNGGVGLLGGPIGSTAQELFEVSDPIVVGVQMNNQLSMSNVTWQDSAFFLNNSNGHTITSAGTTGGSTYNTIQYVFSDGGWYWTIDTGELCHGAYTLYCQHNIVVNSNQNITDTTATTDSNHVLNNTLYNQVGMALGETNGSATEVYEVYDNLQQSPPCGYTALWMSIPGGTFYSQTYGYEDNNGYFGFPNSGDPGAITCPMDNNGAHVIYKGIFSLGLNQRGGATNTAKAMTLVGTTLTCAGCNFALTLDSQVQVGDVVYDTTSHAWANVASITSANILVLTSSTGFVSGHSITVMKQPWANLTPIGSATNYGLHDIHANANFFNPGDGVCPWWNRTAGTSLTCYTSHSVVSNTATASVIGHAIVTLNGWDYGSGSSLAGTNCTSQCPQRVTPLSNTLYVSELLKAMGQSYRVYNGMYVNAGHTGADVGAAWLPNYPAAINGSN